MGPLCLKYKLYKYHLIIFTSLLSFCFVFVCQAQEVAVQATPAAKVNNEAIGLNSLGIQIGETVPDLIITNIHNYKSPTVKLSDFKGKLLILDFWATWCSPCVAMIPKLNSLQQEFGDKIQILSVTYQKKQEVLSFLEKLEKREDEKVDFPMVMEERNLHKLFPHTILPHYVWIKDGKVINITSSKTLTSENIKNVLVNESYLLDEKNDEIPVVYDTDKPLLIKNNGDSNTPFLMYHSLFTGYIPGLLPAGYDVQRSVVDSTLKFVFRNVSLDWLYGIAYGKGQRFLNSSRMIFNVQNKDKIIWNESSGVKYSDWQKEGGIFCYELIIPLELEADMYKMMQQDFERYILDYEASLQKVAKQCYVLKKTSKKDRLKSKGGESLLKVDMYGASLRNVYLNRLIERLDYYYQNSTIPIFNETGYQGKVDLELNTNLSNMDSLNKALEPYDLQFILEEREIEVIVIRDRI